MIPVLQNVQVEGLGSWHILLTLVLKKWRQNNQAVHSSRPGWTARLSLKNKKGRERRGERGRRKGGRKKEAWKEGRLVNNLDASQAA